MIWQEPASTMTPSHDVYPPLPVIHRYAPRSASVISAFNEFWIDTETKDLPPSIGYELYPQPTRGTGAKGSYLVRLPPNYERQLDVGGGDPSTEVYPVLYWLHGGMETQHSAIWALEFYGRKMEEGKMPKCIIIAPQALPKGRYVDNIDGSRPIASIIAIDLVDAVDKRYRTIRHPSARWIEGFSMGGFGALHLAFKFPHVFSGACSSIAGALLPLLSEEPPEIVLDTFAGDQDFADTLHPYYLVKQNLSSIKDRCAVRLLSGDLDTRLAGAIQRMADRFQEVGLEYGRAEAKGAAHDYEYILAGVGDYAFTFWQDAILHVQLV